MTDEPRRPGLVDGIYLTQTETEHVCHLQWGLVLLSRLREQNLDGVMRWVLPVDFLPGATALWGIAVEHADVASPMLAHVVPLPAAPAGVPEADHPDYRDERKP